MAVKPRQRRTYTPVKCEFCGEEMARQALRPHQRYMCQKAPTLENTGDAGAGAQVGIGAGAHKKAWSWADYERAYPKNLWIRATPMSNPPGGITVNRLHVEFVPGHEGCMMTYGPKPGVDMRYSALIPPSHWFHYNESLRSEMVRSQSPNPGGLGIPTSPAIGPLEPMVFVDSETGDRKVIHGWEDYEPV